MKKSILFFRNQSCKIYLVMFFIMQSCHYTQKIPQNKESVPIDSLHYYDENPTIKLSENNQDDAMDKTDSLSFTIMDTIDNMVKAHFDFSGLSLEGGEGYSFYDINTGKIVKSIITLYGEMRRVKIEYFFSQTDIVKVVETNYEYLFPFSDLATVKNEEIDKIDTIITYQMDIKKNDDLPSNTIKRFLKFKKVVPMQIW